MNRLADNPFVVFAIALIAPWLAAWIGSFFLRRQRNLEAGVREDFSIMLAATLTLLGLIIGFSFSMAIGRYRQRKNYEEAKQSAQNMSGPTSCPPTMRRESVRC